MVDIVNGLCGHIYEYGTADINYLYVLCTISRIIATWLESMKLVVSEWQSNLKHDAT